jgi:hypothetical protein
MEGCIVSTRFEPASEQNVGGKSEKNSVVIVFEKNQYVQVDEGILTGVGHGGPLIVDAA